MIRVILSPFPSIVRLNADILDSFVLKPKSDFSSAMVDKLATEMTGLLNGLMQYDK